ncbi:MAG: efflux RND transporter periplasmic adaptor subunit [Burkholderiaceae bacterium]|nr:efflux RND transporter periplasmic adaptor subunit [Burkholderiaceae bacterium]
MKSVVAALVTLVPLVAAAAGFECLIEPSQVIELRASVDGVIAAVHVQRGDVLRKGQVLVELQSAAEKVAVESARYRAQMEGQITTARNRIDYATKKFERLTDLRQENFASAQALDEAEAERRLAESELQSAIESRELARIEHRRAQEQLALRTLASPFDGVVVDRMLNPGDLAESGSGRKPVLKIAQINPLRVDIVMPAALIDSVKPGMKATVSPVGMSAKYTAKVKMVDRVIDAASATFVARVELANPKLKLPGGVRCQAEISGVASPVSPLRALRPAQ